MIQLATQILTERNKELFSIKTFRISETNDFQEIRDPLCSRLKKN